MSDLIDRQSAIEALERGKDKSAKGEVGGFYNIIIQKDIDRIMQLPSAEPKKGKWIKTARWGRVYYCNQCRNYLDFDGVNAGRGSTNFCPNCGADMRGEQNEL